MVAYAKPQQRKEEECERLTGEREIRSSLLERGQAVGDGKGRRRQDAPQIARSWDE